MITRKSDRIEKVPFGQILAEKPVGRLLNEIYLFMYFS